jgi:hypothetical protein
VLKPLGVVVELIGVLAFKRRLHLTYGDLLSAGLLNDVEKSATEVLREFPPQSFSLGDDISRKVPSG